MIVLKNDDYSPRKVGQSTRARPPDQGGRPIYKTQPAITLKPITLSLASLVKLADTDAGRLLTVWLRRNPDGSPKDLKTLAWGELRYAQGYADGLRRAQEDNPMVALSEAIAADLELLDGAVTVSELNRSQAEPGQYTHMHGIHRYNEGARDCLAKVAGMVRKALA